tara:strand:+ start:958 stop:1305 length:348 start_codon:yes stop_codon:yes gene_type:complete
MTTQAANASLCKNQFGDGAKISINVTNSSNKKKGREEKVENQAITLHLHESADEKPPTLTEWLSIIHLDHIFNKLKELGVEEVEDMNLLDEEDMNSLDLKKIQMKKLKRAIANIE